jgi:excisionase family DNA binding protein
MSEGSGLYDNTVRLREYLCTFVDDWGATGPTLDELESVVSRAYAAGATRVTELEARLVEATKEREELRVTWKTCEVAALAAQADAKRLREALLRVMKQGNQCRHYYTGLTDEGNSKCGICGEVIAKGRERDARDAWETAMRETFDLTAIPSLTPAPSQPIVPPAPPTDDAVEEMARWLALECYSRSWEWDAASDTARAPLLSIARAVLARYGLPPAEPPPATATDERVEEMARWLETAGRDWHNRRVLDWTTLQCQAYGLLLRYGLPPTLREKSAAILKEGLPDQLTAGALYLHLALFGSEPITEEDIKKANRPTSGTRRQTREVLCVAGRGPCAGPVGAVCEGRWPERSCRDPGETRMSAAPNATAADVVEYPLFNVEEAARYLRLSSKTLYNLVSAGRVPCVHVLGRALRFEKAALDRIIAAGRRPGSLDAGGGIRPHGDLT